MPLLITANGSRLCEAVDFVKQKDKMENKSENLTQNPPFCKADVSKSLNCGMITPQTRLAAACRRFQFEAMKSLGIFWLIEKTPWLKIKEPWNKLYKRSKR